MGTARVRWCHSELVPLPFLIPPPNTVNKNVFNFESQARTVSKYTESWNTHRSSALIHAGVCTIFMNTILGILHYFTSRILPFDFLPSKTQWDRLKQGHTLPGTGPSDRTDNPCVMILQTLETLCGDSFDRSRTISSRGSIPYPPWLPLPAARSELRSSHRQQGVQLRHVSDHRRRHQRHRAGPASV